MSTIKLINRYDLILIIFILIFSIGSFFYMDAFIESEGKLANIYYDNQLIVTMDLNENGTYLLKKEKYPDLLDDLEVEVKNGSIRISKETSPNHICSKQGATSSPTMPLVCLPNKVFVEVVGENVSEGSDVMIQ